jgi:hypothetical protein
MKTIKFYDIPDLAYQLGIYLTYDRDPKDLRLHVEQTHPFGAKTENRYNKATDYLDGLVMTGNGWEIYASYDVSGFDYWMKNMQETNSVNIVIGFTDTQEIDQDEILPLFNAINKYIDKIYYFRNKYSYDPTPKRYLTETE